MRLRDADVVFLVDECAGIHVVAGIEAAGGKARLLTDVLQVGALDEDWIPRVAELGCHAYITRDTAQKTNPRERLLIETCGVHVFFLRGGNLRFDQLRERARQHCQGMIRLVVNHAPPFIAHVSENAVTVKKTAGRRGDQRRS